MHKLRNSLAALSALALAGSLTTAVVAQDEPVTIDSPEGITWILEQQAVDGPTMLARLPQLVLASLVMEDGNAGGNSGCNSWFGDYTLEGDSLTFGPLGSTMMACPGPAMAVEQAFIANLGAGASWTSDGATLTLRDADGSAIMLFEAAPEATVVGSWVAQGINNGSGGVESNQYTSTVTAVFDEEGRLTGVDGCNDYSTTYEVDGESISIAPEFATTMMACEDPIGELSRQYYAALGAAAMWAVDASGSLELRDLDGALQVKYLPAE